VLAALWDLVWDGLVTNDSLAPLRAVVSGKTAVSRASIRPRPGRLSRIGPPAGAGRWSLVAPMLEPSPTPTEVQHARALQLLERYGVLTREAALGEGLEGGFAGVYPVLKALEERGAVRRGYFVSGLGAAQFALPGAVDRLRSLRDSSEAAPVVLAATDPAQPFGAALPWPEPTGAARPSRAAGAHVVIADGQPLAFLERGGHSLVTFAATAERPAWAVALAGMVERGRYRSLEIRKVDGAPVRESPDAVEALLAAGFVDGYKGLVKRRPGR
jgi:ATP-dependent Lhr-like helicase